MTTFGSFDAKTHLPELLERARKGERITITRRGAPVAMLVPAEPLPRKDRSQVIAELKTFGSGRTLKKGTTVRDLIEEGRRF
jgi:prevent-host-death family protein